MLELESKPQSNNSNVKTSVGFDISNFDLNHWFLLGGQFLIIVWMGSFFFKDLNQFERVHNLLLLLGIFVNILFVIFLVYKNQRKISLLWIILLLILPIIFWSVSFMKQFSGDKELLQNWLFCSFIIYIGPLLLYAHFHPILFILKLATRKNH